VCDGGGGSRNSGAAVNTVASEDVAGAHNLTRDFQNLRGKIVLGT
jgi:accessory colonization factor AcfC